jgi:hypothetical protein
MKYKLTARRLIFFVKITVIFVEDIPLCLMTYKINKLSCYKINNLFIL